MRRWTKQSKQATHLPRISPGLFPTHTDPSSFIHSSITKKCHQLWTDQKPSHNKVTIIKLTPIPWSSSNFKSCRLEKIVTRLRIGRTRLTESHFISQIISPFSVDTSTYAIYKCFLFFDNNLLPMQYDILRPQFV